MLLGMPGVRAEVPAGGREMLPASDLKAYVGGASAQGASAETVPEADRQFGKAQRVILPQHPAHPWDAGARSQLIGSLQEGDIGLVTFNGNVGDLPEE